MNRYIDEGYRYKTAKMNDNENHDNLKNFYFLNFEKRDAELVELREVAYQGDTELMLKIYAERLKDPDMNAININADIERLKHIKDLESRVLIEKSFSLDGVPVTSMLPLVKIYETERKKNGSSEKNNNGNSQQPLKS